MKKIDDVVGNFWSKVDRYGDDECWGWKSGTTSMGYARLYIHRVPVIASRFSWELHFGTIPDGMEVCHTCDNPLCTNPKHLFLGTHYDNMKDMQRKGRAKNPPVAYGENNTSAKLTEEKVKEIFRLFRSGTSKYKIAKQFKVTLQAICLIINRTNWAWVEIPK